MRGGGTRKSTSESMNITKKNTYTSIFYWETWESFLRSYTKWTTISIFLSMHVIECYFHTHVEQAWLSHWTVWICGLEFIAIYIYVLLISLQILCTDKFIAGCDKSAYLDQYGALRHFVWPHVIADEQYFNVSIAWTSSWRSTFVVNRCQPV